MRAKFLLRYALALTAIIAAFVFFPVRASWADEDPDYGLGIARVSYLEGDTVFNSVDTDEWAALSQNFTLRDGDRLWAGDNSKIEVSFSGGNKAWLNYQSELDDTKLRHDPEGDVHQLALVSGEGSFYVKNFKVLNSVFQVDAPNASARAYGKAYFRMSVLSDGTTQIGVRSGSVEVESQDGSVTTLGKGDLLEVYPDGTPSQVGPIPARDDWDGWVSSRINYYRQTYRSSRYLPPEVRDYSYEFDQGGRWVDYPDYGYVWVPAVEVGWTPYSNGRWVWIAGDFVWLPYDPWYAPFHYGRWTFIVSTGWCWVPPLPGVTFWSPGYVGWAWGPDYAYWVPLAPGEVYYGWGNYGPHSVNIIQNKTVNITNVYVNSRVTNAVVVVNKNDFVLGKTTRVTVQQKNNPFVVKGAGGARVIGAPPVKEFKPVKATMLPRPEARVPAHALPPRHVEEMKSFVQERQPVVGKKGSAFMPGSRLPSEMKRPERPQGREEGPKRGPAFGPERRGPARETPPVKGGPGMRAPAERGMIESVPPPGGGREGQRKGPGEKRPGLEAPRPAERGPGARIAPPQPGRVQPREQPGMAPEERGPGRERKRGRAPGETGVTPQPAPEVQPAPAPEKRRGREPEGMVIEPQPAPQAERGPRPERKRERLPEGMVIEPQRVPQVERGPAPERRRERVPENPSAQPGVRETGPAPMSRPENVQPRELPAMKPGKGRPAEEKKPKAAPEKPGQEKQKEKKEKEKEGQ